MATENSPSAVARAGACWDLAWEDRNHPLVLRYLPPPDLLAPLTLPQASSPRHQQARAQIAAIAIDKARHQQSCVSYSRNRNHYGQRGTRYDERPDLYRYALIVPSVDAFASAGYLENFVAPNNPRCGWQSMFRATPALIKELGEAPPLAKPKARALIQLRDENKQFIDFRDTEQTSRMGRHVAQINEAISAQAIWLPPEIGERHGNVLMIGDTYVNLGNTACFRIFNESFKHGGRFYGHYTQSLPKVVRAQLTINGEPIAEPDYPAHHLHILYALEGLPRPGDPYEIDGWPHDIVKRGVLILINAPTLRSAIGALVDRCGVDGSAAARLIANIRHKHKPIAAHFHSGVGRRLQRIDSDMAERVELGLIRQGIVALPIHDSFIVPERHENVAREQMAEAFETVVSRASGASRKAPPLQELKAETSYTMVTPFPRPPLPLPPPSFPPFIPSLAHSDPLFDPVRKLTSSGRSAVLQAQRQRCVDQAFLAGLVGISRSTLANILAGRFGTSPHTAERIGAIIAETPAFERQPYLPGLAWAA